MTIKIQCPHCAQRISASDDVIATVVECPTCQQSFKAVPIETPAPPQSADLVPESSPEPESPPEPVSPPAPDAAPAPAPAPVPLAPRAPTPHTHAPIHPNPLRHPLATPTRKPRGRTAIVAGVALAVVAAGLYCWQTFGPGFLPAGWNPGKKAPSTETPTESSAASATAGKTNPNDRAETGSVAFEGTWRGTIPRTLVSKSYDVPVTITYNDRGEGFPKFETPPEDAAEFKAFALATIYQAGEKHRVTLLRDWEISLNPDQQTMTWTEINGPAKLKFTKQ